ncbi:MAG TPA: guanine deaminase, partial [Rhodobacter sp.]|nr:guanine deaminase [Rhodobacter sp.]
MAQLITGRILSFEHDPFLAGPTAAKIHDAVLVEGGKIVGLGSLAALKAHAPQAPLTSYGESLVMAGFVDAHVHFP